MFLLTEAGIKYKYYKNLAPNWNKFNWKQMKTKLK